MAKFDKNIKNEFLDQDIFDDEYFDEEEYIDEEDDIEDYEEEAPLGESAGDYSLTEDSDEEFNEETDDSESAEKVVSGETSGSNKAKWYVVHTYSGYENKVKDNIEKIVENRGMQDLIQCIAMPTEDVVEIKSTGERKVRSRKMFPGYVIVKMIVTSESWYLIRNTQGVTGFVGNGTDPIPLTDEEVRRMGVETVVTKIDAEVGDHVKVIDGPFENFMGVIEEVNIEKRMLKVRISMFGRETPVELEFGQIEKMV